MNHTASPLWQTPAVRHLAWLCQAPPLLDDQPLFRPADWLPEDWMTRLALLDAAPGPLLAWLEQAPSRRLGHYFERLYAYLLEQLLGWPVLLQNQPVRDTRGRTLGELDFIVCNPVTAAAEHHELAVKYYLGLPEPDRVRWYGPNARDRLDLKRDRLLNHQSRMTERPETLSLLAAQDLAGPLTARIVMPGNLFYPLQPPCPRAPDWVNPHHERGYWLALSELPGLDHDHWVPLHKPDWLGPFQCRQPPCPQAVADQLQRIARDRTAGLFARMAPRPDGQGYDEKDRYFVVPDSWPGEEARAMA
ncbi:MAG: DUF1853 family protein [Marinobacter sp.]|uniref:DUF1853 family protein n=1 Tax=Marinobacter sp. TaxID=50741 RepID=UPI00299E8FFD|nr:DUF1853 family protein [Marinobacter sp.]MDX1633804.1 DUF1853 family protein [Marinobacter sp.]